MSIIPFSPKSSEGIQAFLDSIPRVDEMDDDMLREYREKIGEAIEALDAVEPRNMNSEAYEAWAENHETLEDILDEILDYLDEIGDGQ